MNEMTNKQARDQVKARISDLIRDNLDLCRMRQVDLAVEMGVSTGQVANWLNGRCLPSLPAALAMAQVFGVTVEQLALGEETK